MATVMATVMATFNTLWKQPQVLADQISESRLWISSCDTHNSFVLVVINCVQTNYGIDGIRVAVNLQQMGIFTKSWLNRI